MYACNRCENIDTEICLHCIASDDLITKPTYFKRAKPINFKNMMEEQSEIDINKCKGRE